MPSQKDFPVGTRVRVVSTKDLNSDDGYYYGVGSVGEVMYHPSHVPGSVIVRFDPDRYTGRASEEECCGWAEENIDDFHDRAYTWHVGVCDLTEANTLFDVRKP